MRRAKFHSAAYRALTTVNAPLPTHIDAHTLVDCLTLKNTDTKWRPHLKSFFEDVSSDAIMDMVIEDSITFDNLLKCMSFWDFEEDENARWIREMAT